MGKSWRRDAKNDRWRKAKQQKSTKKSGGHSQPESSSNDEWFNQRYREDGSRI